MRSSSVKAVAIARSEYFAWPPRAWCREQGLFPAELEAWKRDAVAGLGEPRATSAVEARQDRRRVKELERELHRKDKALAETAALLVLAKKLGAVFRDGEDE